MSAIPLIPGATYYAGFSRPFFISDAMIRSHLEGLGATDVRFFKREKATPPVTPGTDPTATDDWDEWLSARYDGAPKTVEQVKRWKWAVRLVPPKPRPGQPPQLQPAPSPPGVVPPLPPGVPEPIMGKVPVWVDAMGLASGLYLIWHVATRRPSREQ